MLRRALAAALFGLLVLPSVVTASGTQAEGVLVFGGTGRLGAAVVRELVAAGYPVTVFARPASDRARLEGVEVGYVTGDMLDAGQVRAAFSQGPFHTVVEASARGESGNDFYPTAMAHIIAGARAGGVRHIILHGSVGAGDNIDYFPQANFGRMRETLAAKGRAEQMLIDSGIEYTIIRNGILLSADLPATGTAALSADQRLMRQVTRADLAKLTVLCVNNPDYVNGIWHAVDPSLPVPEAYR